MYAMIDDGGERNKRCCTKPTCLLLFWYILYRL